MTISSPDFSNNGRIPDKYTCKGDNVSPALKFDLVPDGTKSLALIIDDPDAPGGTFNHWLVWNIPAATRDLPEAWPASGAVAGTNGFGRAAYGGPCPPPGHGPHHYHFKLYALDNNLALPAGATRTKFNQAIKGHVLDQAELVGTFER